MSDSALIHLNRELEPFLTEQEYKKFAQNLSILLFDKKYSQKYTCKECSETCVFDVKDDLPDMILSCHNGILEEQELDVNELVRFKFELEKNLNLIAEKNGINFKFLQKTTNIVLFGTKKVHSKVYKCFYVNRLIIQNNLEQSRILELRTYCKSDEIAYIITPAEFSLDNKTESFLKEQFCELISLKNIIENDLIINKIGITNENDSKRAGCPHL